MRQQVLIQLRLLGPHPTQHSFVHGGIEWLPGVSGEGLLNGSRISFGDEENVMELNNGDGCTVLGID